jgi:hypothetical protein
VEDVAGRDIAGGCEAGNLRVSGACVRLVGELRWGGDSLENLREGGCSAGEGSPELGSFRENVGVGCSCPLFVCLGWGQTYRDDVVVINAYAVFPLGGPRTEDGRHLVDLWRCPPMDFQLKFKVKMDRRGTIDAFATGHWVGICVSSICADQNEERGSFASSS